MIFSGKPLIVRVFLHPPEAEISTFHSFVYAGPMLHFSLLVSTGETVVRDSFAFADLISAVRL